MAIGVTWNLDVQVVHFGRKEVKVTGIRTSVDPAPEREDTYTVDGHADKPGKIMGDLRSRHTTKITRETNQAVRVAEMKTNGEAAMNRWEVDNG